jgi:hypothetical protein
LDPETILPGKTNKTTTCRATLDRFPYGSCPRCCPDPPNRPKRLPFVGSYEIQRIDVRPDTSYFSAKCREHAVCQIEKVGDQLPYFFIAISDQKWDVIV